MVRTWHFYCWGMGSIPNQGTEILQRNWDLRASLVAQIVKKPPAMQETRVQSLGWEDPLGEGMATHSSILAWRILWTGEPGRQQSMGLQKVGQDCETKHSARCGQKKKSLFKANNRKEYYYYDKHTPPNLQYTNIYWWSMKDFPLKIMNETRMPANPVF